MKEDSLDKLIHRLFEDELGPAEKTELTAALKASPEARARYLRSASIHSALARLAAAEQALPTPEQATQRRRPFKAMLPWLALAACLTLALGGLFFRRVPAGQWPVISETREAIWKEPPALSASGQVPQGTPLELKDGFLRLTYPTGASVTLEGPCRFSVDAPESIAVQHGRVSVHAPPGAQGFVVDTPGGRFVDLGTEFGLAIGHDGETPVVLTEVFTGEVEVLATATPTRLFKGDSRALVRETGQAALLTSLDEAPITLVNHARVLPTVSKPETETNLALGKPVSSPGHYAHKHGSVFPPERLTDGRLNDSGVPGDWGFWLAPNQEDGEFTVDLQTPQTVGRISLQNTNNRSIGDRGLAGFEAYGSLDNETFFPLTGGELPRITQSKGAVFPFHDFTFPPVTVRFVKLVGTSHYRHPARPPHRKDHSGGLNEIRLFAR